MIETFIHNFRMFKAFFEQYYTLRTYYTIPYICNKSKWNFRIVFQIPGYPIA